ncbi:hypothetical protein MNBD_IGNAVI01-2720 [hydrothermal vent metagenome]|uniref:Outer membrane protein n=1 Tax=hydrothermal vent metagenome TaxID=652676 RepID=A0A3B1CMN9_9ZZZZ
MIRIIIILTIFQQVFLLAQSGSRKDNSKKIAEKTVVQFKWSNDFIYQTDYYYTNGFAFEVLGPWAEANPINSILIPSSKKNISQFGITLVQDIYTPRERYNVEEQLEGDRPFAAYLLLGFIKKSIDPENKIKITSELQIGVLGPAALGEQTQNGIHDMLPTSSRINGWENQISNSLAIDYSAEFYKALFEFSWFDFSGIVKGKLGTPFTQAEIGGAIRLGWFDSYPQGFEMFSPKNWTAYFFAEVFGKSVGYNATLQGGLFSTSIYTLEKINRFIGSYRLGISATYNLFTIEMAVTYNTPEFPGALSHKWGYAIIRVGF